MASPSAGALLLAALLFPALPAGAAVEVPVGPRAIGMGGAFCAIANDATALFWNPAGLALIEHQEVSGSYADLFQTGIKDDFIAFVLPLSSTRILAGDWYHSGFNDGELEYGEDRFDAAFAMKLRDELAIGVVGKYLQRGTDLDGATVRRGSGYGLDLGALYSPWRRLRVGVAGQDVFTTRLRYDRGDVEPVYDPLWRAGISYAVPLLETTAAAQIDDRYHVGAEWTPLPIVALRAGLEGDRKGPDGPGLAAGMGLKAGPLRFDYALSRHPVLGSTHHFGVSLGFNFNPPQVRIETVDAHPMYASLHQAYAREPFGVVRVRSLSDRPLSARLSVYVRGAMSAPTERDIVVRPGVVQEVPLTAVFDDDVIEVTTDRAVRVSVGITYSSLRLSRTERRSASTFLYGRGAVRWGDGVGQAAAFVTARDPIVSSFARAATHKVALADPVPFGNRQIAFTAAIFDALGALGVAYVPDPRNPYSTVSRESEAVDTVQYPVETLDRRTGDCDDTSVLLAALLANVGVRTRFADAPRHLFLLVGTGVHARNRLALGLDSTLYVVDDDEVWIPLETTAIASGFTGAWREGADAYADWSSRGAVTAVDVTEAQDRYAPAQPQIGGLSAPSIDPSSIEAQLDQDVRTVESWRKSYMARYAKLSWPAGASAEGLYEIAEMFLGAGRAAEARSRILPLLETDAQRARAHNNVAVTYAAEGNLPKALGHVQAAIAADSSDPGVWLNLGVLRFVAEDSLGAQITLREALRRSGGYSAACQLLGVPPGELAASARESGASADADLASLQDLLRGIRRPRSAAGGAPESREREREGSMRSLFLAEEGQAAGVRPLNSLLYWKSH